jgi:LCP family protein required for cell wall assembly
MRNIDSANQKSSPQVKISTATPQKASVNLLTTKPKNGGKKILKRLLVFIVIVIVVLGSVVFLRAANLSQKIFVGQKNTFFKKLVDIIRGGGNNEKLIGDGPYLSDTMILAQIRPDINQITLTSIPRDYLVDLPENSGQQKINAAFALGFVKNKDWDQAGSWARQVVQNMSGLKIPYFAVIDFSGFEKAINQIGGVDIHIDRTFTDNTYPDSGTGYLPPLTFTEGNEHMDGIRALEFARSRHAQGIEGSDFSRSVRQQKIIAAFKQKILNLNLISDAGKFNSLLSTFADHFHTNMSPAALLRINSLINQNGASNSPKILSLSLDPETNLICPEILASNSAYVLVPCKSTKDVENYFKNSFSIGKINAEKSIVWIGSSTGNKEAYNTAYRKLTDAGIIVYNLSYSKDNLQSTVVYQVNPKPGTAEFIANVLNGTQVTLPPPGVHVDSSKVDIIIILGQNAPVEVAPTPYIRPPAQVPASTTTSTITTLTPTSTPTSTIVNSTNSTATKPSKTK